MTDGRCEPRIFALTDARAPREAPHDRLALSFVGGFDPHAHNYHWESKEHHKHRRRQSEWRECDLCTTAHGKLGGFEKVNQTQGVAFSGFHADVRPLCRKKGAAPMIEGSVSFSRAVAAVLFGAPVEISWVP